MGSPKALVEVGGQSFLERVLRALREGGCDDLLCIAPAEPDAIATAALAAGARVVINRDPTSEQVDSIRLALDALAPEVAAAVILPVDHPLVHASSIAAVIRTFRATGKPIVRASYHGRPGHPTLFGRALFTEFQPGLPAGARSVIARHARDVEDVAVQDEGVDIDIDTPSSLPPTEPPG